MKNLRTFLGALAFLSLCLLARRLDLPALLARVEELGPWAFPAYAGLYTLACLLLIPGSLLTLGAGAVFGTGLGTLYSSLAATLGATAAFLVGRHLAYDWVAARAASYPRFDAVRRAVGQDGWRIVALLRLSPLFPFVLLNYALGATAVRLRDYVTASWVGMLPGSLLYSYAGALAGDLARLHGRRRTAGDWAFYALGLAATAAAALYAARAARESVERETKAAGGGP